MNFTMLKRIIYFLIYFDLWTIFAERISQERHDIMIYMYVGKFMKLVFPIMELLQSQNLSLSNFVLINEFCINFGARCNNSKYNNWMLTTNVVKGLVL